MKTNEIREKYLDFFVQQGHTRCPSDVLVPTWDPSVLFTPAGMNQFKDHFPGQSQTGIHAGHQLPEMPAHRRHRKRGRTAYHHTFFEMLGNFSFGDYFKREAIHWAWEFSDRQTVVGHRSRPAERVRLLDDDEAAEIWANDIGCPTASSGWTKTTISGRPALPATAPMASADRAARSFYHPDQGEEVEIWNLVFTQFNRVGDPPDNLAAAAQQEHRYRHGAGAVRGHAARRHDAITTSTFCGPSSRRPPKSAVSLCSRIR